MSESVVQPAEPTPSTLSLWQSDPGGWSPTFCEPLLRPAFAFLEEHVERDSILVDLGSGDGHVTAALAAAGYFSVGVDLDPGSIRRAAAEFPTGRWIRARIEQLPIRAGSVEGVFAFSSFQYLDRIAALDECARVLAPRGKFAIVENLTANPVAIVARWWTRRSKVRSAPHRVYTAHLRRDDLRLYADHLGNPTDTYFHLLSPILLIFDAMLRKVMNSSLISPDRRPVAAVFRADRWLLNAMPYLRHFAWQALLTGETRQLVHTEHDRVPSKSSAIVRDLSCASLAHLGANSEADAPKVLGVWCRRRRFRRRLSR